MNNLHIDLTKLSPNEIKELYKIMYNVSDDYCRVIEIYWDNIVELDRIFLIN